MRIFTRNFFSLVVTLLITQVFLQTSYALDLTKSFNNKLDLSKIPAMVKWKKDYNLVMIDQIRIEKKNRGRAVRKVINLLKNKKIVVFDYLTMTPKINSIGIYYGASDYFQPIDNDGYAIMTFKISQVLDEQSVLARCEGTTFIQIRNNLQHKVLSSLGNGRPNRTYSGMTYQQIVELTKSVFELPIHLTNIDTKSVFEGELVKMRGVVIYKGKYRYETISHYIKDGVDLQFISYEQMLDFLNRKE